MNKKKLFNARMNDSFLNYTELYHPYIFSLLALRYAVDHDYYRLYHDTIIVYTMILYYRKYHDTIIAYITRITGFSTLSPPQSKYCSVAGAVVVECSTEQQWQWVY